MNAKSSWSGLRVGVVLLALGPLLGACATDVFQTRQALEQKVATARTRADHDGLAAWYEQEAKAAREKAEQYRRITSSYGTSRGALYSGSGMLGHWQNLVRQYELASEDNLALAGLHRRMAAEAKE